MCYCAPAIASIRYMRPCPSGAVSRTPSVKRVVLTSSCAAIYGDPHEFGKDHVYTEADWNPTASETVLPYYYRCGAEARSSGPGWPASYLFARPASYLFARPGRSHRYLGTAVLLPACTCACAC